MAVHGRSIHRRGKSEVEKRIDRGVVMPVYDVVPDRVGKGRRVEDAIPRNGGDMDKGDRQPA